ncbi:MAG: protease modulator HflK [Verrucomicrobiia bacterium]
MSHEHDPQVHEHPAPAPVGPDDAGSQALAEALRSSFAIVKVAMVLMVVAFFSSGFFTVGPSEKAVILRFGSPVGGGQKVLLGAGLHWSFPYPIDEVVKIPISEIQKVTSTTGWYATTPEQELSGEELPAGPSLNPAVDGYAFTADRNIIHTRATLNYHIVEPIKYIFDFASASNSIQNALDNALLFTAAKFNVDDILTRDVAGFQDAVRQRVSDLVEQEQLGVVIDSCLVQSIAPRQLKDVFAQVTIARQNQSKQINNANTYKDKTLLAATGQASAITNEAAAASANYVKYVKADAGAFTDLLPKYESNPNLFVQQRLVEAMSQALTNVQDKIFFSTRADGKPRELRLMLNREPAAPKPAPANP